MFLRRRPQYHLKGESPLLIWASGKMSILNSLSELRNLLKRMIPFREFSWLMPAEKQVLTNHGTAIFIKRKLKEAGSPLRPGDIPFSETNSGMPQMLSVEEIQKLKEKFKEAAVRSLKAGFKVIELHAAHGYLIHEFLSPLSNNRTDQYGGSFVNRIRFLLEVTEEIRTVWPTEYPLFVRISASDWTEGGWSIDDSVKLTGILERKGVDLIDCSSGGNIEGARIPVGPGYQVTFSERIRKEAGIKTGTVGMITEAFQAETILSTGQADLILMAREMLRDPYFPLRAARELGYTNMEWPVQYQRAKN